MEQLRRPIHRSQPPALPEMPAPGGATQGTVLVSYGTMLESFDLAGLSVADARSLMQRPYNLSPEAEVTVNARDATPDQVLRAGDHLEFVHLSGEKGAVG
ncbi:MAG: hypothetical protein ABFS46_19985 [Myxococcota bacterium]